MTRNNQQDMLLLSKPSLNESIANLKQTLGPQLKKVSSKKIIDTYSRMIKQEKEKRKVIKEKKSNNRRYKADNQAKTILEYSFVQDYSDNMINDDMYFEENSHLLKKSYSVYERNKEKKLLMHKKVEEQRNKQRLHELAELKSSPDLAPLSKLIVEEKFKYDDRPLYLRYQDEVEYKKLKIEDIKRNMRSNEGENLINTRLKQRSKSYNRENFEEWINSKELWIKQREAKVAYMKQNLEEMEKNDEDLVFKPVINKTSAIIANFKNNIDNSNTAFYEKLYNKHQEKIRNIENRKKKLTPSFQPKVNRCPSYLKIKTIQELRSKTFYFEANEDKTKSTTMNSTSQNRLVKSTDGSRTLLRSKSTNTLTKPSSSSISPSDKDSLYKLNIYNSSAWMKQVNCVKTNKKSNEILSLSMKFGK